MLTQQTAHRQPSPGGPESGEVWESGQRRFRRNKCEEAVAHFWDIALQTHVETPRLKT
jgi:hypothetical protein